MKHEPQGLDRFAKVDMSLVRMRQRHHQKTPYEIAFSAYIYCLKNRDMEAAEVIRKRLQCLKEKE